MMKLNPRISSLVAASCVLGLASSSFAAVIAVVDSGTDVKHVEFKGKIWDNPDDADDAIDNDGNKLVDDIHGWNFADDNNRLVERKLIGTFPPEVYKYFELQTKILNGEATDEEKAWMKEKLQDAAFVQMLGKFGNFVHGTHVAGIAAKDADGAKIMTLRMIGRAASELFTVPAVGVYASSDLKEKLIRLGLDALAMAQGQGMQPVGDYLAAKKPRVANCSFGASRRTIKPVLKPIIEKIKGAELTDEELNGYADYFLNKTVAAMQSSLTDPSPETLFVIAAGNDGTNNDTAPTAPANIRAMNTITVAATLGRSRLASFSNYGETMVDIAAPGVGIRSAAPGDAFVQLSGTSQAAPYVANLAGRVMDVNSALSIADVRQILMETVDKKEFLAKRVSSGGIANAERALYAARLSLNMPVSDAIRQSNRVPPMLESLSDRSLDEKDLFVMPLPSFIR